mgnify:CR=1 FL=1|jgi:DNA invertase Pin-like site-specific DNA recombinase
MSGERLLVGNGSMTHKQAVDKAREGRWNGGFAPYGYRLVDGVLQINEDESPAIRTIFEQYVNTDTGANGFPNIWRPTVFRNSPVRTVPLPFSAQH